MVKRSCLLYFFILLFITQSKAQILDSVAGSVVNSESKLPIANAIVQIYNASDLIYKISSNTDGKFNIPINIFKTYTSLTVKHLNFFPLTIDKSQIIKKGLEKENGTGVYELVPTSIQLKEVIIKKRKRYRDTTVIDLSKTNFERTFMIGDMFARDNGFYIDNAGQLFYKGKKVSDVSVNGEPFFGKNNLNVYNNLPALVLENIQIIETDIDSVTNISMIRPVVKVNMIFKDKYEKGKFGSANFGFGTKTRYIGSTNLYSYNNKEQISVALNSNNINIHTSQPSEPYIMFSANGSDIIKHIPKVEYRNILFKKLELTTSINAAIENKNLISKSERTEKILNQETKTYNQSKMRSLGIDQGFANLIYRINAQNIVTSNFNINFFNANQTDSLDHRVRFDTLETNSSMFKNRIHEKKTFSYESIYNKLFLSKKGRSLVIGVKAEKRYSQTKEENNVHTSELQKPIYYSSNGSYRASEDDRSIRIGYTEPLNETSVLSFRLNYVKTSIHYNESTNDKNFENDRLIINKISNDFIESSIQFEKTFDKIAIIGNFGGIFYRRKSNVSHISTFSPDFLLRSDIRLNAKTSFNVKYTAQPSFPTIGQLTNINNSFNLNSQHSANLELKPEMKQRLDFSYEVKQSDSLSISVSAGAYLISSKFGFNITSNPNSIQQTSITNIGTAFAPEASVSISFLTKNGTNIIFRSGVSSHQTPTIVNKTKTLNKSLEFSHHVSSEKEIIKGVLTIAPTLTLSNNIFKYGASTSKLTSFTFTDRLSIRIQKFQINLFPFINSSIGVSKNSSWAMNGEIKKNIWRNRGTVWLKSYDIFNSFSYANNFIGASYIETLTYSNLQRYSLLGISFKFDNFK